MRSIIQASILAVPLAGTATLGSAQTEPAEPFVGVGDIVVTAQRRAESLQKVPLSVSVASADTLRERNKRYVTTISSTIGRGPGDYSQSFALDAFQSVGLALNLRY